MKEIAAERGIQPAGGGVRVLMLSGERLLLAPAAAPLNDAQQRHIEMARGVESLDIVVVSSETGPQDPIRLAPNVSIHPVRAGNFLSVLVRIYRAAASLAGQGKTDVLTSEDPFLFGGVGLLLRLRFGLALNCQLHADVLGNPYWIRKRPFIRRLLSIWGRIVLRRSDSVRVVSRKVEGVVRSICSPTTPVYLIPTGAGIELERFSSADGSDMRQRWASGGERIALTVGRLAVEKDHVTLMNAAERILGAGGKIRFIVVGGGEEEERLRREIDRRELADTIVLAGHVAYRDLPRYFAAADLFVLTSLYEGMGRVLIEAAAAGLPIVTTDVGIASDIVVDGEDGFIVPIEDGGAVAEAILTVIEDDGRLHAFKAGARSKDLSAFDRKHLLREVPLMWVETAARRKGVAREGT